MASEKLRILVAGGGGFIGSHLAKRLKGEGHWVRIADTKRNEYFQESDICHEFLQADLRNMESCMKSCQGIDWVYNLAADMGGMGFIQSNHSVILYNNVLISFNMVEAARRNGVKRFFYSSSACIYPEHKQLDTANPGLKESDAWPAAPQGTPPVYSRNSPLFKMPTVWKRLPRKNCASTTEKTSTWNSVLDASTTSTDLKEPGKVEEKRLLLLSAERPGVLLLPLDSKCGEMENKPDPSATSMIA